MRAKPLDGVRVLDLTRLLPGPVCTLHLADMGADVLKVEDPGAGDYARWMPPVDKVHSPFFLAINRNKRSMKLNLKSDRGRELFLSLAAKADVVVEGNRPGVVERLGIGYGAVSSVNQAIVYCAISGYGQDGPYRDRAGHDINYLSYAGIAEQMGPAEGGPALINFQIADLAGGSLSAAMGILAALVEARATGQGRYVDISMTDCSFAHGVAALSSQLARGKTQPRGRDRLTGGLPCYGFYQTKDGRHMSVGALEPKFWKTLCVELGRPDLAERGLVLGDDCDVVRAEIAAIFKSESQAHWTEHLADKDCCVAPVLTMGEAMANEQLVARDMVVEVDNPEDGRLAQFALPVKFSDFEFEVARPAPGHGAHTDEVLAELGLSADEIAALRKNAVV